VDDDDNEKSVGWFRRSLKTGGIAGGIAGFVCGLIITFFAIWMRGLFVRGEVPPMSREELGVAAAMFIGAALTGIAGGCVFGVAAGRLFRDKGRFGTFTKIAGVVGGVLGMNVFFLILIGAEFYWWLVRLFMHMFGNGILWWGVLIALIVVTWKLFRQKRRRES